MERLKEAGYATHHVRKWHLGFADYCYTLTVRGFDTTDGFFIGAQKHFNQTSLEMITYPQCKENLNYPYTNEIYVHGVVNAGLQGISGTICFKTKAVNIINQHVADHGLNNVSVFLYASFNTPHRPI
eukprot:gene30734-40023_t